MATLNTASYPDLTAQGDIEFTTGVASVDANARSSGIWKTSIWIDGTGNTKVFSEFDAEEYARKKDEGAQASQAVFQQGYSLTVAPIRFGLDTAITYEMRKDNKYEEITNMFTDLGAQCANRIELDLTHRITFGTAITYTNLDGDTISIDTGDDFALFYSAHTLTGSSDTYRNILANNPQVSTGALEAMEKMNVENTLNNLGQKKALKYDIIYTTDDPNTGNTVAEILQSTAKISAPNAGVKNIYQAKYRHVVLPLIATDASGNVDSTKAKYWGLASSSAKGAQLKFALREAPNMTAASPNSNSEEFSTEDWKYKGRARYAIGSVVGRGITLSKGDGSA